MPLVNADTIIQNPFQPGQWLPAGDFMRYFGGQIEPNGQVNVDANTVMRMSDGQSTATAGEIEAARIFGSKKPTEQKPAEDNSASATTAASVKNLLNQYGLQELEPLVDGWIRQGMSWSEIEVQLRDPSTQAGKVVDRIYPEVRMRTEKGLEPMSIAQIQAYRTQAKQVLRSAGLPAGFYDSNEDFTNLILSDVSPAELQARVQDGYNAIAHADPADKALLKDYYGVDEGAMAAYFLDPTRALPLIQQQVNAAKIGGAAARVGVNIGRGGAEELGALNLSASEAANVFGQVAQNLPTLQDLQQRFNDPNDPLTAEHYAKALVVNDPRELLHATRLVAQQKSLYSGGTGLFAADQSGGLSGLGAR